MKNENRYWIFVTVQSQTKFHKTGIKCLHFKADFKILLGSEQYKIYCSSK